MKQKMKLEIDSIPSNESFARVVVAAFLTRLNPTMEEVADIKTAVSEAVTNAIIHGYENQPGNVFMDCYLAGRTFITEIRDEGMGIEDIALAMQPFYTSKAGLDRSGMGFTVMEAFMDHVKVTSVPGCGTTVHMEKTLREVDTDE